MTKIHPTCDFWGHDWIVRTVEYGVGWMWVGEYGSGAWYCRTCRCAGTKTRSTGEIRLATKPLPEKYKHGHMPDKGGDE